MHEERRRYFFPRAWIAWLLIVFTSLFNLGAIAMGEKYAEQGGRLSAAIKDMLIVKGFCKTPRDCHDLLPSYGGHGDRVRSAFYEVGERNSEAFNAIVGLVVQDGIRITSGTPITITGYRETHEEYRKSGVLSKDVKPFLILEVSK